ncbi:hypothetical protein ACFFX1_28755 [Dactylosporangium sucinum]|uniref:Uncharacterized protein n=1 Tax=Dactylosporangium sucinum TaxID=1424081 RepID=A0A917UAB8_9ACTN|nr:hypothetical protein [Dactylosporangium sucinum]GGM70689.1 hypothetical protein GCM10007977_085670 [Dactylosporangium sucinum]
MTTTTKKIPTPLYAAAGAGDYAYEQLRKLPGQVAQLRDRVGDLRPAGADATLRADIDRLAVVARRNAGAFLASAQAGAQVVQHRAAAVYTGLVARGEKVVGNARTAEARIELEPAEKTVTTEVKATTPAKKTTTAAKKTAAAKK